MRRQQAAAVLPIVKISTRYVIDGGERRFGVDVVNVGVGPAFLDHGIIAWDGEVLDGVEGLRAKLTATGGEALEVWTEPLTGQVLGGGGAFTLVEASWDEASGSDPEAVRQTVGLFRDKARVSACYCSVYDRCWQTQMNRLDRPERADRCVSGSR